MKSAEILLVKYGNPAVEEVAIASVREHTNLNLHTFTIVDNFAADRGLSAVWNDVISRSTKDFILLLNSDTRVEAGWLDHLIRTAEETGAEAVGPMTDKCGNPSQVGRTASGILEVDQLSGFCLLVRRAAWQRVGGFREDVQFYGCESMFLRRLTKKVVDRSVFVHHEAGASVKAAGRAEEERAIGADVWRRNRAFDWKQRLAVIGSPDSPSPLWQGINHGVREFAREGMSAVHFPNTASSATVLEFAPTVIVLVSQRWDVIARWSSILRKTRIPAGCWFNDLRAARGSDARGRPAPASVMAHAFRKLFLCFGDSPAYPWKDWEAESKAKAVYMPQGSIVHTELAPLNIQQELVFIGGTANSKFHSDRLAVTQALGAEVVNEIQRPGRIAIEQRSRELYRQSRFALVMSPIVPGYNSLRLYNVMAYGGLPIVRRFPGLERLFKDGRHLLGWKTAAEAQALMDAWRTEPEACERLRKRAWRLQQAKHTAGFRLMNMVANLTTDDASFWGYTP